MSKFSHRIYRMIQTTSQPVFNYYKAQTVREKVYWNIKILLSHVIFVNFDLKDQINSMKEDYIF